MALPFGFLARAKYLTVGLVVILIQAFLYINADYIYGDYAGIARNTFHIYFLFLAIFMSGYGVKLPTMKKPLGEFWNFAVGFLATAVIVVFVPFIGTFTSEVVVLALGFGLLHGFVKAYVETVVFQWILPSVARLGNVIASILFGIFHFSMVVMSRGFGWEAILVMFVLMILGFIWCKTREKIGIMGATGSHFAYNLFVLGGLTSFGII